jgi:hypothetical protein
MYANSAFSVFFPNKKGLLMVEMLIRMKWLLFLTKTHFQKRFVKIKE